MSSIQNKKWQLMPKISDKLIKQYPDVNQVVLQLLFNRGLTAKKDIDLFFSSDYEKETHDPFLFNDMEESVELIIKHIKKGHKVAVYGDYDTDGATSSAILVETLETLKTKVRVYIPDRVEEGYGLNKKAIDNLIKDDIKLIITVDNGIRGKNEVEYIKNKKIDIIITDHHIAPEEKNEIPNCLIINPAVLDDGYPFRFLAGAGVAFKLASAIISKSKLDEKNKEILEERLLDLVAIGTVADCVSLLGENRVLVKKGLEILNKTKRIGVKKLIEVAKINNGKKLDSWNIGYQISPRLNAAGRMDHANTAFEILITRDEAEATELAKNLNDKNVERQEMTEYIFSQVIEGIEEKGEKDNIIVAVAPDNQKWNEGIIGLVASKIKEKYYRPALIITKSEEGYKGSGRSVDGFNMIEAIEECAQLLDKYGGHPMACGFSLSEKNKGEFIKKIKSIANEKIKEIDLRPRVDIEIELEMENINEEFLIDLEKFSPFGNGNEQPKFVSYKVDIVDIMNMGFQSQHIKFKLKNNNSGIINALGFGQAEKWRNLSIGDTIDIVYYLDRNDFNGRTETQMKIIDIKLHK